MPVFRSLLSDGGKLKHHGTEWCTYCDRDIVEVIIEEATKYDNEEATKFADITTLSDAPVRRIGKQRGEHPHWKTYLKSCF